MKFRELIELRVANLPFIFDLIMLNFFNILFTVEVLDTIIEKEVQILFKHYAHYTLYKNHAKFKCSSNDFERYKTT
jgi:hypothetical protein